MWPDTDSRLEEKNHAEQDNSTTNQIKKLKHDFYVRHALLKIHARDTHGKTPTRFPASPEYRPFKNIFPPPWAAWNGEITDKKVTIIMK